MRVFARAGGYVQVKTRLDSHGAPELLDKRGLESLDRLLLPLNVPGKERAAAEIQRHFRQSFVHGQKHEAVAVNAGLVARRFLQRLAEADADVFHGVVVVHFRVALGLHLKVEAAVLGEKLEHVVEERNAGRYFVAAGSVDVEAEADVGLSGFSRYF